MHDHFGTPLADGNIVLVPFRIIHVGPVEDYCNCELETLFPRRLDGQTQKVFVLNTAAVVKVPSKECQVYDLLNALKPSGVPDSAEPRKEDHHA